MDESAFWLELEQRVSREFEGMRGANNQLRSFWCDGLVPKRYHIEQADPRITGLAWIVRNDDQQEWEFTLFLSHPFASRETIEWEKLLPPANVTKWIALDIEARRIQFAPMAAMPDER
jgi:hypothetical protein